MSGVREAAEMRNQLRKLMKDMQKVTDEVENLKKTHVEQQLEIENLKDTMQSMTEQQETNLQSSIETSTCQGCLNNQPNQLAHMEEGGCLAE